MLDLFAGGNFFLVVRVKKKSQNFTFFLLTLAALAWYFYIMGWLQKYYFWTDSHSKINLTEIPQKSKNLDPKTQFFFYTVLQGFLT
jgi:hypothetical protein